MNMLRWPRRPKTFDSSAGEHLEFRSRCRRYIVRRVKITGYKRTWYQALVVLSERKIDFVDNTRFERPPTAMAACEQHAQRTRPRQKKLPRMAHAGA